MVFIGLLLLSRAMLFTPKTAMAIATAEASANRAIMLCFICCCLSIESWLTVYSSKIHSAQDISQRRLAFGREQLHRHHALVPFGLRVTPHHLLLAGNLQHAAPLPVGIGLVTTR